MPSAKYNLPCSCDNLKMFTFFCIAVITFTVLVTDSSSLPVVPKGDSTLQISNETDPQNIININDTSLPNDENDDNDEVPLASEKSGRGATGKATHETKRYVGTPTVISPSPALIAKKKLPSNNCVPPEHKKRELEDAIDGDDVHFVNIINTNSFIESRISMETTAGDNNDTEHVQYSKSYWQSLGDRKCEEVVRVLNNAAPKGRQVLCHWTYECTYDEERHPKYLIWTKCSSYCNRGCSSSGNSLCKPIYYHMKILKVTGGSCYQNTTVPSTGSSYSIGSTTSSGDTDSSNDGSLIWTIKEKQISIGCECSSDEQ